MSKTINVDRVRACMDPIRGWFEDYYCGCVSAVVLHRRDLVGYCGRHGSSRRQVFRIHPTLEEPHHD
jgi:hypothetical protein